MSEQQDSLAERMQIGLAEKLFPLFDMVITERLEYYQKNPGLRPTPHAVPSMIGGYANKCGAIAVACNLVPGPFGMLAIVPEIAMIMREQLMMLYDIGVAYGHRKITRELLLGIMLTGAGAGAGGLLVIQGGKVLVKRASLRLIQRLVTVLGGKVTQRVIKSALAKWVPIVGAAALGIWARYSTKKLGEDAVGVFSKTIVIEEEQEVFDDGEVVEEPASALMERIKLLIYLMHIDRHADNREKEFLTPIVEGAPLSGAQKAELNSAIASGSSPQVNYAVFEGQPDEQISVLMDLVSLALADNRMHVSEKLFLKKVAERFGISEQDLTELIGAETSAVSRS